MAPCPWLETDRIGRGRGECIGGVPDGAQVPRRHGVADRAGMAPPFDASQRFCYCCSAMKPCLSAIRISAIRISATCISATCTTAATLVALQRAQMLRLLRVDGARRLRPARP